MDTIDDILKAAALLVRNGYTVTYEAPPIGKAGTGVYLHITDETVEELNPPRRFRDIANGE
jgi:hypothetical protein